LWFYVYDEYVIFARAYSPSMKSKDNVPQGKSSLQFEIYYIKQNSLKYSDEEVKSKVINSITEWGISTEEDIQIVDVRHVEYANVVFIKIWNKTER
jgi:protoporphyrinogen oxidase